MSGQDNDAVQWLSWGTFSVCGEIHADAKNGRVAAGKDIRVVGLDVSEWEERKGHTLSAAMITGVYDQGVQTLVIGIGVYGRVRCPVDVRTDIKRHGIAEVILQRTPEACRTYSAFLRQGKPAALLAHGAC